MTMRAAPQAHDHALCDQLRENLDAHTRHVVELDGRKHAAVAIVVVDSDAHDAAFLLCRRTSTLRSHSRQWALPGGRWDAGESIERTALRELHEELGLELDESAVLGLLDDYPTRSGYVITPVVIWADGEVELTPNPDEVEQVFRIGLDELCRDDSPRFVDIPESEHPVVQVPIGDTLIHAPTGAVLVQFRWVCLEGRIDERVHEFEQPVFAWR